MLSSRSFSLTLPSAQKCQHARSLIISQAVSCVEHLLEFCHFWCNDYFCLLGLLFSRKRKEAQRPCRWCSPLYFTTTYITCISHPSLVTKHLSQSVTVFACGSFTMSMSVLCTLHVCHGEFAADTPSIRSPSLSPLDSTFTVTTSTHFPSSEWRTLTYNINYPEALGGVLSVLVACPLHTAEHPYTRTQSSYCMRLLQLILGVVPAERLDPCDHMMAGKV